MSSLVLSVGAACFFGIMISCMVMRRNGACDEALFGAWISGIVSAGMIVGSAAMLHPVGTPMEEAMWLCFRSSDCDMVHFAEALRP